MDILMQSTNYSAVYFKKYRFLCEGILYSCEIVILLLTCQGNSLYYKVKSMEINLTLTCKCSAIEEMIKRQYRSAVSGLSMRVRRFFSSSRRPYIVLLLVRSQVSLLRLKPFTIWTCLGSLC